MLGNFRVEPLPKDGAGYKCNFEVFKRDDKWNVIDLIGCDRAAYRAITSADWLMVRAELKSHNSDVCLRAVCDFHINIIDQLFKAVE